MPITSVTGDQQPDAAGTLHDVIVTTFTVTLDGGNVAGPFTVTVPDDGNAVSATSALIDAKVAEVTGIYGLNP